MAALLIVLGLVLLLATAYNGLGVLLLIIGVILLFVPVGPVGRWPARW